MKGIILAGGSGTRLAPLTGVLSKQLLPIYDKPMIYYPISIVMLSSVREILIISSKEHLSLYQEMLGDGSRFGVQFVYQEQTEPRGLCDAYLLGESFLDGDSSLLVLGDNFIYGAGISQFLGEVAKNLSGAHICAHPVGDPSAFGVLELSKEGRVLSIEEKPKNPKSNLAIPGIYWMDERASKFAKTVQPSERGELEITSLLECYMKKDKLLASVFPRGVAWLDTGTFQGLLEASQFVNAVQKHQGTMIACLEEIAYRKGWIDSSGLQKQAEKLQKSPYGAYLFHLIKTLDS